jgi:hypothetical protein
VLLLLERQLLTSAKRDNNVLVKRSALYFKVFHGRVLQFRVLCGDFRSGECRGIAI